jgi:hypothetical protein
VLLDEPDIIIVTTADPQEFVSGDESWKHEKAITNLVGMFTKPLPSEWRAGQR